MVLKQMNYASNENKKYEMVNPKFVVIDGEERTLYQIKSLFTSEVLGVKKGDLGGFIEREANLCYSEGNAWIYDNSVVIGDSCVRGDARVSQESYIKGKSYISGNTIVIHSEIEDSKIFGEAKVSNSMVVNSIIRDYAKIEKTNIVKNCIIGDHAEIHFADEVINHNDNKHNLQISGYTEIGNKSVINISKGHEVIMLSGNFVEDAVITGEHSYYIGNFTEDRYKNMLFYMSSKDYNIHLVYDDEVYDVEEFRLKISETFKDNETMLQLVELQIEIAEKWIGLHK